MPVILEKHSKYVSMYMARAELPETASFSSAVLKVYPAVEFDAHQQVGVQVESLVLESQTR